MIKTYKARGGSVKYSEKLRDPRWQKKRLEIMQRDNFMCCVCSDGTSTLNVHHKKYSGDPWDVSNDSLETLCESCHEIRSEINKKFQSLDSFVVNEFLSEFIDADFNTLTSLSTIAACFRRIKAEPDAREELIGIVNKAIICLSRGI